MHLRIGTRQSPLALWQANHVAKLLESGGHEVELVKITTTGDVSTAPLSSPGPLGSSGGAGLFTKEIQRALLENRCDVAVHSLKDLPTEPVDGLQLTAVPTREATDDCMLSSRYSSFAELPLGARVGTGSPRRRAQLLRLRPDLTLLEIRGNVDSRIRKMEEGEYDAILLAYAGLERLQIADRITERFQCEDMLPAVGQAALGLETRDSEGEIIQAVAPLSHPESHFAVLIERTMLRTLRAGCLTPLAGLATIDQDEVRLSARVFSNDFTEMIEQHWKWSLKTDGTLPQLDLQHAIDLGIQAANDLTELGADELIHEQA